MTYGPDAVAELVEESGLRYPVSIERLEREHALANITVDEKGNSIMLAELLAKGDVDRLQSKEDIHDQLGPIFEQVKEERRSGIIDKLKKTFLGR